MGSIPHHDEQGKPDSPANPAAPPLLPVTGVPTREITLLEHVDAVIKGGKLVKGAVANQ